MSNYFIAGVGKVDLFKGSDLLLTSKTLVDSSINLSVTLEDIRAGAGAKLYGKYAHTSTMGMKLTEAMFKMELLAANVGANFETVRGTAVDVVSGTATGGVVDISTITPKPLYPGVEKVVVWVAPKGTNDFQTCTVTGGSTTVNAIGLTDGEVCIKYIKENAADKTIKVAGNFIPDTLTAILEANIYAGDSENLAQSTKVGKLVITIPRFMLNGTMDLSMTMTGASQMPIEGSALAVTDTSDCNDDNDYYAIISEVMTNATWYTDLLAVYIEGSDFTIAASGKKPTGVFGGYKGGSIKMLKVPTEVVLTADTGTFANGVYTAPSTGTEDTITAKTITGAGIPVLTDSIKVTIG